MRNQGRADRDVMESSKVEPKAHAASVDHVTGLGLQQMRTKSSQLYKGRGFEAPMDVSNHTCNSGSQGKY